MKILIIAPFLLACLLPISCSVSKEYSDLPTSLYEDFKHERWENMYSCKGKEFKSRVPYKTFVKSMESQKKKYKVTEFEVLDVGVQRNKYIISSISYVVRSQSKEGVGVSQRGKQVWEIKDDKVICRDMGISMFFPMNEDLYYTEMLKNRNK